MPVEEIVGIVAGVLTAISMLPQVVTTIRKKEAKDVSIGMLLLLTAGLVGWVIYGFLKKDMPVLVTNSFSVVVNIVMFFLRLKYGKK